MKRYRLIVLFVATLAFSACGPRQETLPAEVVQQAQNEYESGFVCLQNDCLMEALPHFFEVANCLERLPEDMTDEEMLLASRAYYQMAHVFRVKMENNTELDLCVLSFFGFRLKEMADILDLRENTVAKYRSHIKKKTQTKSIKGLLEPFLA